MWVESCERLRLSEAGGLRKGGWFWLTEEREEERIVAVGRHGGKGGGAEERVSQGGGKERLLEAREARRCGAEEQLRLVDVQDA